MRSIIPLSLLLIFIPCTVGYYYLYLAAKYLNYKNIQDQIQLGSIENVISVLEIASIDEDNIHWKTDQKEFEYKGQMYDVVSCVREKDSVYLHCILDIKEKKLLVGLKHQKTHEPSGTRLELKILQLNFIKPLRNCLQYPEGQFFVFLHFSAKIFSVISDIHSPPPKQIQFS